MNNNNFEMPIGFTFLLSINQNALKYFSNLNINTKEQIKTYIQNSINSDDAKYRINNAINCMNNNTIEFLNKN